MGINANAAKIAASPITGPAIKTGVVVRLYTADFRSNFHKSQYGCSQGWPWRPAKTAFVRLMMLSIIGASTIAIPICIIPVGANIIQPNFQISNTRIVNAI